MTYQRVNEVRFTVDEYIKYSFNSLYDGFIKKMDFNQYDSPYTADKYLLASIVACIEGQIYIDMQNKTWYFWNVAKIKELNNNANSYALLNLYEFMKSNEEFYNFIIKYFSLWHENKNSDFTYDIFHKKDLEENFNLLINIIEEDIKNMQNNKDDNLLEVYNKLYDNLISSFCYSKKIINFN